MIPAPASTRIGYSAGPVSRTLRITGRSRSAPAIPTARPDRHLDRELLHDDREVAVLLRRELDHPDHERDAHRVVHSCLALENRPGATADLARTEDGERDGRIGRCDRRADEAREDPVEAEQVVRCERDEPGGREGAEHAEREDRSGRPPESSNTDVEAAVEEDDDEGDDRQPLDLLDRDDILERRERSPRARPRRRGRGRRRATRSGPPPAFRAVRRTRSPTPRARSNPKSAISVIETDTESTGATGRPL